MGAKILVLLFFLLPTSFIYSQNGRSPHILKAYLTKIDLNQSVSALEENNFFDMQDTTLWVHITFNPNLNLKNTQILFQLFKKSSTTRFIVSQEKIKPSDFMIRHLIHLNDSLLSSGNYSIQISVLTYNKDSVLVRSNTELPFQLFRGKNNNVHNFEKPILVDDGLIDMNKTFVSTYTISQLKKNINALDPISTPTELIFIKRIVEQDSIDYLRRFFYSFWSNRSSENPELEWKKYAEKLNYVSKQYGVSNMLGYETDRGRIYLKYGEPTKIILAPGEKNAKPYEIWTYETTANKNLVNFLFYQPGMMGSNVYLLHSNLPIELVNPYWAQTLFSDIENVDKLSHIAFEYFK